jgi:N utilization substance protein B
MTLRRKAREYALQMLFQWDVGSHDPAQMKANFWKGTRSEKKTRDFANQLFEGTVAAVGEIDPLITKHAKNWRVERMAAIDRNILRLATYELRRDDPPAKVVINEAVELAKKFSSEESAPFINGILDAVAKTGSKEVRK